MKENEISFLARGIIFRVHKNLGPGLLESVYETALYDELMRIGLNVRKQVPLPVVYNERFHEHGYRIDLVVEEKVIIEVKSVEAIAPVHVKQLLTYLKLSGKKLGLLVNFNCVDIKTGIIRKVNGLEG